MDLRSPKTPDKDAHRCKGCTSDSRGFELKYYSINEVAEILGVHSETVRRQVWERKLPAVRVGRNVRISDRDLRAYLKTNRTEIAA